MAKRHIKFNKLSKKYTLEVQITITKQFKIRVVLAKYLILCAAHILGCGINFNIKDKK